MSMVALWISAFVPISTNVLPDKRFCNKKESLHLIFCNQCSYKRVYPLSLNTEKWRRK